MRYVTAYATCKLPWSTDSHTSPLVTTPTGGVVAARTIVVAARARFTTGATVGCRTCAWVVRHGGITLLIAVFLRIQRGHVSVQRAGSGSWVTNQAGAQDGWQARRRHCELHVSRPCDARCIGVHAATVHKNTPRMPGIDANTGKPPCVLVHTHPSTRTDTDTATHTYTQHEPWSSDW